MFSEHLGLSLRLNGFKHIEEEKANIKSDCQLTDRFNFYLFEHVSMYNASCHLSRESLLAYLRNYINKSKSDVCSGFSHLQLIYIY